MRSSVLLWYWCISWNATIPSWYLQSLSCPPLYKLFVGVFPLVVDLTCPASTLTLLVPVLPLPPSGLVVKTPATSQPSPDPSTAPPSWPTLPTMEAVFLRNFRLYLPLNHANFPKANLLLNSLST